MNAHQSQIKENLKRQGPDIYSNSREYILDELGLVDLVLYRSFLDIRETSSDIAGQFKGLVITDNEVLRLLTNSLNNDMPEPEKIINEDIKKNIDQKENELNKKCD